jgi:hypothetical protein
MQDALTVGFAQATVNAAIREQLAQTAGSAKTGAEAATAAQRNYVKELERTIALTPALTAQGKKQFEAAIKLGASAEEMGTAFGMSAKQVELLRASMETAEKTSKHAGKTLSDQARDMVDRIEREVDARHELQIWMGNNQEALTTFTTKAATEQLAIQMRQLDATTSAWFELQRAMNAVQARPGLSSLPGAQLPIPTVPKIPLTFFEQMFNPKDIGTALGNAISGAIQGGGNVLAAAGGSVGQLLTSNLANSLTKSNEGGAPILSGWIGGMVSATLPGVGALLGPLVGKLTDTLRDAFGGPSRDELLGRDVVAQFEQTLQGTLSATQKLAAGNESWKLTTIAVRDAYIAAGKTAADAEKAVAKLWASSKQGADASRLAVLEIQAVMDIAAAKQEEIAQSQQDSAQAIQDATAGIRSQLDALASEYDALNKSIANEAPEEVLGIAETLARERMKALEVERTGLEAEMDRVTKQVEENLAGLGPAAEDAARAIEDALRNIRIEPISIPIESSGVPALGSGGIVRKPTLALIGESGPEAVVPLGSEFGGSGGPITVNLIADGRQLAEVTVPHIPHVVRRRT